MRRVASVLVLGGLFFGTSYADPVRINPQATGMMMGNAGLALEGSRESAIMNPASLADITEVEWQILPVTIQVPYQHSLFRSAVDYAKLVDDDDSSVSEQRTAFEDLAGEAVTSSMKARVNLYPSYTRPRFHVGAFLDADVDAHFRFGGFGSNQLMEAGDTDFTAGLILAAAHSFFENNLQIGVTAKPVYRISPFEQPTQGTQSILLGLNEAGDVKDNLIGEGATSSRAFGVGVDLGLKYWFSRDLWDHPMYQNAITYLRPAIGLTFQDIGNFHFFRSEGQVMPENIQQSVSVGVAFHPEWNFIKSRFALDIRNLNAGQSLWNKLHVGWESLLWGFWAVRFGLSQGYLTAGTGLDWRFLQFDVFMTAQEVGRHARLQSQRSLGFRLAASF